MYKLFVSGFYETLINSEEAVSMSTMVEIDRIRKKGIIFVAATENDLDSVLDYNRDFPFLDYIICYNGAYIYDVEKNKVLYKKNIGISIVKKIKKLFGNYKLYFYTSNNHYYFDNASSDECNFSEFIQNYQKDIYKIEIECDSKEALSNIVEVIEKEDVNANFFVRSFNTRYYVEIVKKDINKFSAIEVISKKKKINIEEVVSCGALITDLELVKNVGLGIAVSNGCTEVKKAAKEITFSNECRGIENALKKYF